MRVVSKFLTADVRIVTVRLEGRRVIVEGMVKEMMPMTVEMEPADAPRMLAALVAPVRERLASRLPERLRRLVAPPAPEEASPLAGAAAARAVP